MLWFWFSCLAAGACACALSWLLARHLHGMASQPDGSVPPQAIGLLRRAWPLVQRLSRLCQPWLSWRMRARLDTMLRRGGLADWQPSQAVGACLLLSLGLCLCGFVPLALQPQASLSRWAWPMLGLLAGLLLPMRWLAARVASRQREMLRAFPFMLDLVTLCIESGMNLHGALLQAARHGPEGPLRQELQAALNAIRAGRARHRALEDMAQRAGIAALGQWVATVRQADHTGMSLGPLLRAQSAQQRAERFQRAETQAMRAPVRMLLPLVACIFPCTFLVIGFPIGVQLLRGLG